MTPNAPSALKPSNPVLPTQVRTLGQALRFAHQQLRDAQVPAAAVDARALIRFATGLSDTELFFRSDDLLDEKAQRSLIAQVIARRVAREPLQHIVGHASLMGVDLEVGPGVFIPRPETEALVDWVLGQVPEQSQNRSRSAGRGPRIVDLCTGSGAIALALASQLPAAEVVAVERSAPALAWAEKNLANYRSRWGSQRAERVHVVHGDVTDMGLLQVAELAPWLGGVDVVVSNPPYVPDSAPVSAEVHADPAEAVFGGADGLDVIRPMMAVVDALLAPGGVVAIEHDDASGSDVSRLLSNGWSYTQVAVHQDLTGRDRFTVGRKAHPGAQEPANLLSESGA